MQKLKCIIVDDEAAAIKIIRTHLKDNPKIEIIGEYQNPILAFQNLNDIDLIFLDITFQDYETSGIKFINQMKHPAKVIIISGSKEHAHDILEFYGNTVLGYLIKPVDALELINVVEKAYQSKLGRNTPLENINPQTSILKKSIHIKTSEKNDQKSIIRIFNYDEILYIKSDGDYKEIHTKDKIFLTLEPLKDIFSRLSKDIFMETHRSYIVNITNIETIEGNEVFFRNSNTKRATITSENKEILRKRIGVYP